jgi:hypothetical protein
MSVFPSQLLASNQRRIAEALSHLFEAYPPSVYQRYSDYIAGFQQRPERLDSWIRWTLFHYSLLSGQLNARLRNGDDILFQTGIEIEPTAKLATIEAGRKRDDINLHFQATVPASIESLCAAILHQELMPLAANYFLYDPALIDSRSVNLLQKSEEKISELIDSAFLDTELVTLSHIRFQDLRPYFEITGEYRSHEIIQEIAGILERNLKQSDILLEITPVSYLVLSPGVDNDKMLERLKSLYFSIKNLLLDYKITCATIRAGTEINFSKIWSDLKL